MTNRTALAITVGCNAQQILADGHVYVSELRELWCDMRPGDCEDDYHGNCLGCAEAWLNSEADGMFVYESVEGTSIIRPAREGE